MNIRWTEDAVLSLEQIDLYLGERSPDAAHKTINLIYHRIEELTDFPNRGREGPEQGTRQLVMSPSPYIATYRITGSTVEILYIRHGAQVM